METKLAPLAFRHAESARTTGTVVLRTLTLLTWIGAALLAVAIEVAMSLGTGGAGRCVAGLATLLLLAAYAAAAPRHFARVSRAATAPVAARSLAALVAGYAVGWTLVLLTVHA